MSNQVNTGILYRGKSLIDGSPIVVVAVYTNFNKKTAAMVQTYILRDDMDPRVANQTGADYAICGNCPLRGKALSDTPVFVEKFNKQTGKNYVRVPLATERACYVNLGQGVLQVYKALQNGNYPVLTPAQARSLGLGRMVRIGTYGDGAAVPAKVWHNLLTDSIGHTGYTHQWASKMRSALPELYMASVHSLDESVAAANLGFRSFRIGEATAGDVICPASVEGGYRSTCEKCGLCAGTSSKSPRNIVIMAHGSGRAYAANVIPTVSI